MLPISVFQWAPLTQSNSPMPCTLSSQSRRPRYWTLVSLAVSVKAMVFSSPPNLSPGGWRGVNALLAIVRCQQASPQGIIIKRRASRHVVPRCRIGASSFRKGPLLSAPSMQDPRPAIVSFDATGLVGDPILAVALPAELLLDRPRPRPHRGIVDCDDVFKRARPKAGPALHQVQVLARALEIGLQTEVRHIDDESVAVPASARVAIPLADAGREMRPSVHDNVALPALPLTHVVEDRDAAWRLHDPTEASAERGAEFGQAAGQTTLPQRHVLRAIVSIDAAGVVARRALGAPWRGRWIEFAAATSGCSALACFSRLQQSETKLPMDGCKLLSVRRERRHPAIGRIDNQRRPCADALDREKHRIVAPGDVHFGAPLLALVARKHCRSLAIELGALFFGEEFLARISGEALQGRIGFIGPDALQIGLTPRRFRGEHGRHLSGRSQDRRQNDGADSSRGR